MLIRLQVSANGRAGRGSALAAIVSQFHRNRPKLNKLKPNLISLLSFCRHKQLLTYAGPLSGMVIKLVADAYPRVVESFLH